MAQQGKRIDDLFFSLGIDDGDRDSRFTESLSNIDEVVLSKDDLVQIERKIKVMHEVGTMVTAIRKTLDHQRDCRENLVPDFADDFGKSGYIAGGLSNAAKLFDEISIQQRYGILDIIDNRIEQAASNSICQPGR